jgi:hypothetical protein
MFAVVTLVTIAIEVGANSAIFSIINGILLKPLYYPNPERLVSVWRTAPDIGLNSVKKATSAWTSCCVFSNEPLSFGAKDLDMVSPCAQVANSKRCMVHLLRLRYPDIDDGSLYIDKFEFGVCADSTDDALIRNGQVGLDF